MSCLSTQTDRHVKEEQYSAEAESANITVQVTLVQSDVCNFCFTFVYHSFQSLFLPIDFKVELGTELFLTWDEDLLF